MAMSSPSTPSRRQVSSPLSTPSPTSKGASPNILTPRSKVQALLASLDDDSDLESPPKRKEVNGRGAAPKTSPEVNRPKSSNENSKDGAGSENGSEDDEEVLSRPKGRMAARMLGHGPSKGMASGSDGSDNDGNAYERIKQQLMGGVKVNGTFKEDKMANEPAEEELEEHRSQRSTVDEQPRGKLLTAKQGGKPSPQLQSTRSRHLSPGLFVSPEAPPKTKDFDIGASKVNSDSDSDLPASPQKNSRFLALVNKKRQERAAQEEAAAQKKAEKAARLEAMSSHRRKGLPRGDSDADSDDEDDAGRKLTQQARPSRKASKKALEEMNRETQRISRNMQLAHEARTRKKITKESLFARFNFHPAVTENQAVDKDENRRASSSSAPAIDTEALPVKDTPPTSPATHEEPSQKGSEPHDMDIGPAKGETPVEIRRIEEENLPTMEDIIAEPILKVDKGKGKAVEQESEVPAVRKESKKTVFTQPAIRIRPQNLKAAAMSSGNDSDSDLEIVSELPLPTRPRKHTVFDRLPAQKATNTRSMQTLRALANLTSPGRDHSKKKASMAPAELQASLQRRARQQAAQERADKLQDLRDRGIIVQTAEEREKDQAEVEDMVDKARREAELIMQKEKAAAKKDCKDKGETDGLENTSDEDEDWQEDEDEEMPQLSGSEEDEDADDSLKHTKRADESDIATSDGEDDEEEEAALDRTGHGAKSLFDTEAAEDEDGEENSGKEEETVEDDNEGHAEDALPKLNRRKSRVRRVLSDDEEEDADSNGAIDITQQPVNVTSSEPRASNPLLSSKPVIPGLGAFGAAPLGLTQMFAGTMADAQSQELENPDALDEGQDSLAFLRGLPAPSLPDFDDAIAGDSQDIVKDSPIKMPDNGGGRSQNPSAIPDIDLNYSQSQHIPTATQYSEFPDPTQDVGFEDSSPPLNRFATPPPSTVDTVLLQSAKEPDSPIIKKKGRLRRRNEAVAVLSDVEAEQLPDAGSGSEEGDFEISANAFDVMRKASKKPPREVETFDKKASHAKGMVDEQAEESEDEYAGLGGASDDDSNAEEDEEVQKMINDEVGVKVDERQLAAFYA